MAEHIVDATPRAPDPAEQIPHAEARPVLFRGNMTHRRSRSLALAHQIARDLAAAELRRRRADCARPELVVRWPDAPGRTPDAILPSKAPLARA